MADDARDAIFVGFNRADEMPVRILVVITPVNDVNFFAAF
jgi:hypothetical protein